MGPFEDPAFIRAEAHYLEPPEERFWDDDEGHAEWVYDGREDELQEKRRGLWEDAA